MPRSVFIDTSAWYGLADPGDFFHKIASSTYSTLLRRGVSFVTTNLVVAESQALILHKMHRVAAQRFLTITHANPRLQIIYATVEINTLAEALLEQYRDQNFTLTHAMSFVVMRERQLTHAFTFDHHFAIANFVLVPAV